MTVAELIAILQQLDPHATVVAPFSPNPSEINVEQIGGAFARESAPYAGSIELSRVDDRRSQFEAPVNQGKVSKDELENIRLADTDAPV